MMAAPPYFARVPCEAVVGGLPFPHPMATFTPDLGKTDELCKEMTTIFENLRYLANESKSTWSGASVNDIMIFGRMRSTLEHRLVMLKLRKAPKDMTILDYQLEVARRAALIFLRCVFHNYKPVSPILRKSKEELMIVIIKGEKKGFKQLDLQLRRGPLTWAMFMGGILSLDAEEETWFAMRIATSIKALGPRRDPLCWHEIENYLKEIAWVDSLNTPECMSLWDRVRGICARDTWQGIWPTFPMDSCVTS